jgi:hypothetical protein
LRSCTGNAKLIPVVLITKWVQGVYCGITVRVIAKHINLCTHQVRRADSLTFIHIDASRPITRITFRTCTFKTRFRIRTRGQVIAIVDAEFALIDVDAALARTLKARITGTVVASLVICTEGIGITIVRAHFTLIDVDAHIPRPFEARVTGTVVASRVICTEGIGITIVRAHFTLIDVGAL